MEIEVEDFENIKNQLEEEYNKYINNPNNFNSYIHTMQDIENWLNNEVLNENNQ
jgi:hypothetical protein